MTWKTTFFEGCSWFKFNNLRLALGKNLKFSTSMEKGLKLKVRKFWGLIPTFVEVTGKKMVEWLFCLPPSWIGLTVLFCNCPLFYNWPVLKTLVSVKLFAGLVWLTGNHMIVSGDWPLWFLKNLKLPSFYLGNFKILEKHARAIYPSRKIVSSTWKKVI